MPINEATPLTSGHFSRHAFPRGASADPPGLAQIRKRVDCRPARRRPAEGRSATRNAAHLGRAAAPSVRPPPEQTIKGKWSPKAATPPPSRPVGGGWGLADTRLVTNVLVCCVPPRPSRCVRPRPPRSRLRPALRTPAPPPGLHPEPKRWADRGQIGMCTPCGSARHGAAHERARPEQHIGLRLGARAGVRLHKPRGRRASQRRRCRRKVGARRGLAVPPGARRCCCCSATACNAREDLAAPEACVAVLSGQRCQPPAAPHNA